MTRILPSVYAIVLNWNLPRDTITCVESVLASDYPSFRVIIVDNGSTDDSQNILEAHFKHQVDFVALYLNHGFGQGNNRGINLAMEKQADYMLLLNNDTIIDKMMISELIECAQSDSSIGIAGPLIYHTDRPDQVWFSGMRFWRQLYIVQRGLHLTSPMRRIEDVDFISGCGMLVKRTVWETIGLFSQDFFMYYEDLDFCLSARKAGFKIITATRAKMWHQVSASSGGSESAIKQYYQIKSSLIFYQKHTTGIWFWLNMTIRIMHAGWTMFKQLFRGRLKLEVIHWYFKGIKEIIRGEA